MQKKFKKLVSSFKSEDARDKKVFGTGGELSALDELLCSSVEEIDSIYETEKQEMEKNSKAKA